MADELKKSIDALREIEAEQLALQKKQAEESAEDRKDRVDKKAFDAQVKAFEKVADLEEQSIRLSEKSFSRLEKGVLAQALKANKRSGETQTAILNLTRDSSLKAFAQVVEGKKASREAESIGLRTSRIIATFQANLLKDTNIGRAILTKTLKKGKGTLHKVVENILDTSLDNNAELKKEIFKLRESVVGKFKSVTDTLGNFRSKLLKIIEVAFNPLELLKFFGKLTFQKVIAPLGMLLGKTLLAGITLPFKGIDKLFGKLFLRLLAPPKKAKRGPGQLGLAEDRREKERKENRLTKILGRLSLALVGFRGLFSKGGAVAALKDTFGGVKKVLLTLGTGAAGGVGAFAATKLGRFGIGAAKIGSRIILPLVAIGLGIKAGFKEFKDTGDIQKAMAEGLVGAAKVLSFGLIDTNELREKLKKPFLGIVEGITGFLDGELSPKNFRSLAEGSAKLATAPFDIAFKMGTQITSSVGRFFGAKKFADDLDAAMKNFNIGETLVGAVDSIVKVFTKATVDNFTGAIKQVDLAKIAKVDSVQSLQTALKAFAESQTQLAGTLGGLRGEQLLEAEAVLRGVEERFAATAKRLSELMSDNATLEAKANRTSPALIPVPSPPIVVPSPSVASPIIAPYSLRNNENTFRRIINKDFSGTQG